MFSELFLNNSIENYIKIGNENALFTMKLEIKISCNDNNFAKNIYFLVLEK